MIPWLMAAPPRTIDLAQPDDWPALSEIHGSGFVVGWSEDEIARLDADPAVTTLVARRGSTFSSRRPVGFVMFRQAAGEAEVLSIAVHPRHRRGGTGRALVEAMLRRLYGERVGEVFLEVGAGNAAALALYRRLGFRQVGERAAYYRGPDGTAVNALVLRLDLAA